MAVFTKFRTSLLRIPGPSSVAPRTLSTSDPSVARNDDRRAATANGTRPQPRSERGQRERTDQAGGGPFRRYGARCSRRHRSQGRHEQRSSAPGFADLARDRVASTRGERGDKGERAASCANVSTASTAAAAATPGVCERVACAPASAACLGDAKKRFLRRPEPRTHDRECECREAAVPTRPILP